MRRKSTSFSLFYPDFGGCHHHFRDFSRAVRYHDPALYSLYQKGFVTILQQTEPFIEESRDLFAIYSLDTTYRIRQVVEPLPCFAYYATHQMVADKVSKAYPFMNSWSPPQSLL